MAQLLVRNLDESIVEELKTSATRHHRSLEAEVRCVLQDYTQRNLSGASYRARVAELRADILHEHQDRPFSDSAELIREDRQR